jgi:hypothetical protein
LLQAGVGLRTLPERIRGVSTPDWLPAWRARKVWRRGFAPGAVPDFPVEIVETRLDEETPA